ncbi:MAG: 16S rRNA (guanine(527)-N(7))-methyltransferase RsmG [Bradyrhizobiaceae bacterium]|nr:16S rRNA (guanine(527)-N(7))-methyltransferase RsmG [Bradyrhizobiaceae bacterium]
MNTRSLEADRARALELVPVSHETAARLDQFAELLLRWQRAVQLVAPSTLPKLWTRHIADSLQLIAHAPDAKIWVDLGSGGGFPGLVIAIALTERAGALVHLVESDARKAAFLREAARLTHAPVKVHAARIESAAEQIGAVDIVTARALAPLPRLLELAQPFLRAGARAVFPKGQHLDEELTEAAKSWMIQSRILPSLTDPSGKILIIESATPR